MHQVQMTVAAQIALRALVLGISAAIVVGVARIVELAVSITTRDLGREQPTLAFVAGVAAAALLVALLAGTWLRSTLRSRRDYGVSSRTGHFDGWSASRTDPGPVVPAMQTDAGPTREAMRSFIDFMESGQQGSLRRVTGIGRSVSVADITLELLALEIRDGVGRLTFVVNDPEQARREIGLRDLALHRNPGPDDLPSILRPELHVTDDLGTTYQVFPGGGGSGGGGNWREEVQFVPSPPASATSLLISVDRLTDQFWLGTMPGRTRPPKVVEGPWTFAVSL
jgi:hypothetical protein